MIPLFGHTRSVVRHHYALLEPVGFVASPIPGWKNVTASIVISPALGARFAQTHFTFAKNGFGQGTTSDEEFCAYFVQGTGTAKIAGKEAALRAGSYLYVPPGTRWAIRAARGSECVIFSRHYESLEGTAAPAPIVGHASKIPGQPFLGDPAARLQTLLPDTPAFDLAVNIFTYQPGATLPMVETHIMEHGLVMLRGQGIYRLGDDWHPVRAGDVIWMAPYCPQWFVAMGREPASYLYYKDVNRSPAL
jgi:(S)-ureidoglycine aminohydrolase